MSMDFVSQVRHGKQLHVVVSAAWPLAFFGFFVLYYTVNTDYGTVQHFNEKQTKTTAKK